MNPVENKWPGDMDEISDISNDTTWGLSWEMSELVDRLLRVRNNFNNTPNNK